MHRVGMSQRIAAIVGAAVIALGSAVLSTGTAQAEVKVNIGAGSSYGKGTIFLNGTVATADRCTIAAVGRDTNGRLLALTAAHCFRESVPPNNIITDLYVQGVKVGTSVGRHYTGPIDGPTLLPGYYDFNFFAIDESKVTIGSERGANVSGGLAPVGFHPGTFTNVCMSGMTSGKRCGFYIGNGGTNPRTNIVGISVQSGDSGGPLYTADGKLLGTGGAGGTGVPAAYYPDARDAVTYAQAQGWIGGFTPIA